MRENEEGKKKGREEEERKEKRRREMNGEREGQGEEGRKGGNKKKFQIQKAHTINSRTKTQQDLTTVRQVEIKVKFSEETWK